MIAYGCGKGRIHRNLQTPYDPKAPEPLKVCTCCERELPVSSFGKIKRKGGSGVKSMCRACENDDKRARRSMKREAVA